MSSWQIPFLQTPMMDTLSESLTRKILSEHEYSAWQQQSYKQQHTKLTDAAGPNEW